MRFGKVLWSALIRRTLMVLVVLSLPTLVACEPFSAGIVSAGANGVANNLVTGLNGAIERLDEAIDDHRSQIKADVLEVISKAREDLGRAARDLEAVAGAIEEKVAADLAGEVSRLTTAAERLIRDVEAAANDAIRHAAEEVRKTTLVLQNGPMREAKATARQFLSRAEHSGDMLVYSVVTGARILTFQIIGFGVMLVAAIGFVIAAVKQRRFGVVVIAPLAIVGLAVALAAPWVAAIGAEKRTRRDPEKNCDESLKAGAELQKIVDQLSGKQMGASPPATGMLPDQVKIEFVRGAAELARLGALINPSIGGIPQTGVTLGGPRLRARIPQGVLRPSLRPGTHASVGNIPKMQPGGVKGGGTDATARGTELASMIIDLAPSCIALSMSPQKADPCERYLNLALSWMGVAIICTSSAQCKPSEQCDELTASCVELGTFCRRPDHCKPGFECDTSINRCVNHTDFRCTGADRCRPGEVCFNQICKDEPSVVGQSCSDNTKLGPCTRGKWQADGNGGVVCSSVQPAYPEVCNNIDDDCNGSVDEGISKNQRCDSELLGQCREGRMICRGGNEVCEGGVASPETCNGKDDNCNGVVDDAPECQPIPMTGGTIECGWMDSNNKTIGDKCAGHRRESCDVVGPQDKNVHAEFVRWSSNDPSDCRCEVHCGTAGPHSGKWTIEITARKFEP